MWGIACMLLGSVAFVMLLFYVVNWPDDDIRLYAWTIISTTLSIFTAVLAFSGVRVLTEMWMPEACAESIACPSLTCIGVLINLGCLSYFKYL